MPAWPITADSVILQPADSLDSHTGSDSAVRTVAVVLDPRLASVLRPHQRESLQFMYDCVMGRRGQGTGCILADEMVSGRGV